MEKAKSATRTLCAIAALVAAGAFAAPLQWVCNWPDARAQTFSLYQGETATFEPEFRINCIPATNVAIEAVWYQTNGMASAWWKLDGNTFAPTNDVGAATYRFFVEARDDGAKLYRANGTLRMLPSPGFVPNEITPPIQRLDFAAIEMVNEPWATPADVDAAVAAAVTNAAPRVETVTLQGTNLTARVVYSASTSPRVSLFIREATTPSGERQYRLIRKEDEQ